MNWIESLDGTFALRLRPNYLQPDTIVLEADGEAICNISRSRGIERMPLRRISARKTAIGQLEVTV